MQNFDIEVAGNQVSRELLLASLRQYMNSIGGQNLAIHVEEKFKSNLQSKPCDKERCECKAPVHLARDARESNAIALLEECITNGDSGSEALQTWFNSERSLIAQAIIEGNSKLRTSSGTNHWR